MKAYSTFPEAPKLVSPSDGLVSYQGHLLGESYLFAKIQLVYSIAPADWVSWLFDTKPSGSEAPVLEL